MSMPDTLIKSENRTLAIPGSAPGSPMSSPEVTDMSAYEDKVRRVRRGPSGLALLLARLTGRIASKRRPKTADSAATLSYGSLARQIDIDLPRENGGRTILMSSSVPSAASNEAIL